MIIGAKTKSINKFENHLGFIPLKSMLEAIYIRDRRKVIEKREIRYGTYWPIEVQDWVLMEVIGKF